MRRLRSLFQFLVLAGLAFGACGDDDDVTGASTRGPASARPTVVATTTILGDVVTAFAGDQLEVVTMMPIGADPHTFQASAQQANAMREADVIVSNGAGFEEGLIDVMDAATDDGVPTFEAISAVETIEFGASGHAHVHDDQADEHDRDDGSDPHFFTDPVRMAASVDGMADFFIENVSGIDAAALRASADDYIAALEALSGEVEELLAAIPAERRVLVTSHEVFGYFAERYGFEVVGAIIPSGTTAAGASAGDLVELAEVIAAERVPAIFGDTSSSDDLAETLASEVGADVEVVALFTESLGDESSGGANYLDMIRTNAQRIADALTT